MTQYDTLTRRTFLKRAGAAGVAVAGGTLWATAPAAARARWFGKRHAPIQHLVISCQENRSFDHYFGYAPQVQARRFGPPPGYTQPDAAGVGHAPFELTALRSRRSAARLVRRARSVQRRQDGRLLPQRRRPHGQRRHRDSVLHGEGAAVLLQPLPQLRPLRELLLLAARADVAEPVLPHVRHVGRHHDERPLGLRHLRLAQAGRSSSTCSTTPT